VTCPNKHQQVSGSIDLDDFLKGLRKVNKGDKNTREQRTLDSQENHKLRRGMYISGFLIICRQRGSYWVLNQGGLGHCKGTSCKRGGADFPILGRKAGPDRSNFGGEKLARILRLKDQKVNREGTLRYDQ